MGREVKTRAAPGLVVYHDLTEAEVAEVKKKAMRAVGGEAVATYSAGEGLAKETLVARRCVVNSAVRKARGKSAPLYLDCCDLTRDERGVVSMRFGYYRLLKRHHDGPVRLLWGSQTTMWESMPVWGALFREALALPEFAALIQETSRHTMEPGCPVEPPIAQVRS